jgi:hypothetical protein
MVSHPRLVLVAGGWWLVAGGWWLVAGGWWLVNEHVRWWLSLAIRMDTRPENAQHFVN